MNGEATTITVPTWANGPDGSGNGGYVSGLLAQCFGDAAQRTEGVVVNLRFPPPLGRALDIEWLDERSLRLVDPSDLVDGAPRLVAEAAVAEDTLDLDVPDAARLLSPDRAVAGAAAGFPYRDVHPFAHCVCCGIARADADPQLAIHAGLVDDCFVPGPDGDRHPVFADVWRPTAALLDAPATWCALDCPSAMPFARPDRPAVLARFEVRLSPDARPEADSEVRVVAWSTLEDGRKLHSRSALVAADDVVLGVARALWIEVRRG